MLFSATACTRSQRGTSSGTEALQAGEVSAEPTPIRKVKTSRLPAVVSVQQRQDRQRRRCEHGQRLGDDQEQPAIDDVGQRAAGQRQQEHRQDGRGLHHGDDDRAGVQVVISQPAPVFCNQVPSQTTTLAIHNRRNIRLRSGSSAGGSLIGARSIA